jgi:aerobic-type carbon monoxide dehydrogenase small subunit (CoxS/CutS family)
MSGPQPPPTIPIAVRVNGTEHHLTLETTLTLLELLRGVLNLTGAKLSCGEQRCGACTVLVDGAPVSACALLAYEADGAEVLTIEGLADDDTLDPVQQAFAESGAVQCGFCTPGMIMTVRALLNDIPEPDDDTVRSALVGNICRCTGYGGILRAVRLAVERERAERGR